MSVRVFTGLVGAGVGVGLLVVGLLLVILFGLRVLLVIRSPHRGRVARGVVAAGGVLAVCGALLYAAADALVIEDTAFRKAVDGAALLTAGVALVLATWVGVRTGRRRAPAARAAPSLPAPPLDSPPDGQPRA
jgi:hypothetical protein